MVCERMNIERMDIERMNMGLSAGVSGMPLGFISPPSSEALWAAQAALPPLRLGVLASGSGSNFEAIAQSIAEGQLNARIEVLIYNNPAAKAADRADRWGFPKQLLNHRDFAQREDLDRAIVETLKAHGVEWVIMAGWMRIVTEVLISAYPNQVLNIHPSLLPAFKGAHAIDQALAAGVKVAGCSVHRVALAVDSGPIVAQAVVPILPTDTVETLHQRVQVQEHHIYPLAIALAATETLC